jgi:hypothetical protein
MYTKKEEGLEKNEERKEKLCPLISITVLKV